MVICAYFTKIYILKYATVICRFWLTIVKNKEIVIRGVSWILDPMANLLTNGPTVEKS
jgi:hypothetical protein